MPIEPTPDRPLRLAVDERRLLREFGRFFRSFESACEELVQNAYRAGAHSIHFSVDHAARTLVVSDDGPGAEDPEALLTAGRTGWSATVVEPAGLGLFALLGLAERVGIESRRGEEGGWVAEITPAAWEGEAIPLRHLPPLAPADHGLRLAVWLKASAGPLGVSARFRHYYPLAVTWEETLPDGRRRRADYPAPQLSGPWLDTPVGRFGPDVPEWREYGLRLHLVWEHRVLAGTRPERDLLAALRRLPDGPIAADALGERGYALVLDPASSIRPVLPERREAVRNAAYHRAIDALAGALVAALNGDGLRATVAALALPPILHGGQYEAGHCTGTDPDGAPLVRPHWADGIAHPVFGALPNDCVLRAAGYVEVGHADYTEPYLEREDDSWYPRLYRRTYYARAPRRGAAGQEALAEALCRLELPAVVGQGGERLAVRAAGLRYAAGMQLGTCETLELVGADGRVIARPDRLVLGWRDATELATDGQPWAPEGEGGLVLLRAAPPEAIALCRRDEELLGWTLTVVDEREEHDFYDYFLWEQEEIHWARLRRLLVEEVARAVDPKGLAAEERYTALAALAEGLADLRLRAQALRPELETARSAYPDVAPLAGLTREIDRFVVATRWLDAEAYDPARSAAPVGRPPTSRSAQ